MCFCCESVLAKRSDSGATSKFRSKKTHHLGQQPACHIPLKSPPTTTARCALLLQMHSWCWHWRLDSVCAGQSPCPKSGGAPERGPRHDPTTTTWVTTARCRHRHRESDSLLLGDHCALQAPRKATRSFCCCHNRRTKHRKWRTRMVATGTGMRVLPPPAPPPSPSAAASPPLSAASYRRCLFLLPPLSLVLLLVLLPAEGIFFGRKRQ